MDWIQKVYNCTKFVRNIVYPPICFLCGQAAEDDYGLCRGCLEELPRNRHRCLRCAAPLPHTHPFVTCGACSVKPSPFARSVIPLIYEAPMDYLVQQMKFHQRLQLVPLMGRLLADEVEVQGEVLPELLVPVPMHRARLRQRGYNQALEVAREASKALRVPVDYKCCRRTRNTVPQTSLQGKLRQKNLRGAFDVWGELPGHVAIVDDVVTTGATVRELARVLRRAGAERIEVWACARAGKSQ